MATLAFLVKDYQRNQFKDLNEVRNKDSPRIGVIQDPYYLSKFGELLPEANIVPVESPREFFQGTMDVDALSFTAEAGGAWTVIYPRIFGSRTQLKHPQDSHGVHCL